MDETYDKINTLTIEQGRFLQYVDVSKMLKVCVIGTYYENEYYEKGKALGQTMKINGEPYTIVGVLEEKADSEEGSSDQCIYIPYTNASKMSWNSTIGSYTIMAADTNRITEAKTILEQTLTKILGSSDFYNIISTKEILDEMTTITNTMKMALVCIAGISLLGGHGHDGGRARIALKHGSFGNSQRVEIPDIAAADGALRAVQQEPDSGLHSGIFPGNGIHALGIHLIVQIL